MKILDRYIGWSIIKVALMTMALCTLMLVGVDLFANLDKYLNAEVGGGAIALMCLYQVPQAIILALGPSLLFATTYFLSMLQANNEMIALLNSGIPQRRIILPCIVIAILMSLVQFAFNEYVGIPASLKREAMENDLFGQSSTYDNRNVTLSDLEGGFVIHTSRFISNEQRILNVTIVMRNEDGSIRSRVDAARGQWSEETGTWSFSDAYVYTLDNEELTVVPVYYAQYDDPLINLEPELFRNMSADIKTMDLGTAVQYLRRMRYLEPSQWSLYATEFWERVLNCLTPLVLMLIACSINYKFKKNILLFAIISSLCVAVVYYVLQMVTLLMAKQGVIGPVWGMLVPIIGVFLLPLVTWKMIR